MDWGPEEDDCIVNGSYTIRYPRLPLKRQMAVSYPPAYYKSLAMVLPLQAKHIENELCAAATFGYQFEGIIERAREDFLYRSVYRQNPSTFRDRFQHTIEYLVEVGRMTKEAGAMALRAAEAIRE